MGQVDVSQIAVEVVTPFEPGNATMPGLTTERFDAGEGTQWYIVPPVVDSGDELRSKVIKAIRVTGKRTNANAKCYGYDVNSSINVTDLEDGTNSSTGAIPLADSTQVAQSKRHEINVKNAVLSTVRIDGDDTGETTRDRVDEIVIEQAIQGARR